MVNLDGIDTICYVPSSCHSSNFIDLKNKEVVLVPTKTPRSKTKYALFAVPFKHNFIVLNTSAANIAVKNSICNRRFSFLGRRQNIVFENFIENYKADLYISDNRTIIEVKSLISLNEPALFPTVYSERTQQQLKYF